MYLRCGDINEVKWVFKRMVDKDVVLYNMIILGLVMYGESFEVIKEFWDMVNFGLG